MLQKVFAFVGGRSTGFLGSFFIVGNVLHYLHRLDGTYIGFMTALLGFVIGHSIKEDLLSTDKPKE